MRVEISVGVGRGQVAVVDLLAPANSRGTSAVRPFEPRSPPHPSTAGCETRHTPQQFADRPYSARKTVIGSTRVARRTGSSAANPATVASTDEELASDTQSNGSTP